MNRVIAAVVLLALSIGLAVGGRLLITNATSELISVMEQDRYMTLRSSHTSKERALKTQEKWESKEIALTALLPHSELDSIEIAIKNLSAYHSQGLVEEYIKALDECISRLEHIEESEMPDIKNIF